MPDLNNNNHSRSALDGLRILIVEDTYIVADEIISMVRSFGCEPVGPFAHVADAIDAIQHDHIAGALLDVNLGDEKSYPIADELLAQQIPFIFMTGYSSSHLAPEFRLSPALSKPFTRPQLRQAMEAVLGHPVAHR